MRACCLCPAGVPGAGGPACGAGLLCVPVGGGPPASRPRCELRSARRLEARPGPATAHGRRSQALRCPPHRRRCVAHVCWVRRLVVRPGPATAHGRRSLAHQSLRRPPHRRRCVAVRVWARRLEARFWLPNSNSARNSRFTVSNFEFVSLELQRFREVLNNDRDKLRAKFIRCLSHRCAWSSAAGSTNPTAREAMGVLQH